MTQTDTKELILKAATRHLQHAGFHALSFQGIADELGLRKPSLYHHFASKEELGLVVIQQYAEWFTRWIEKNKARPASKKLHEYFVIFEKFSRDDEKLCPIGALSIDINGLPASMKKALQSLYLLHFEWLRENLRENARLKKTRPRMSLDDMTRLVMATLQGALLVARVSPEPGAFAGIRKNLEVLVGGVSAH